MLVISSVTMFPQKKTAKSHTAEQNQTPELSQYEDWQKAEFAMYSLYVPKDFKIIKKPGVDSTYWEYRSESVDFVIIEGPYAGNPSPTKNSSKKIKYTSLLIDGVNMEMVSYEDESRSHKYVRAISFRPPKWKISWVAIFIDSKNTEGQEMAKKIFESIRFKDKN